MSNQYVNYLFSVLGEPLGVGTLLHLLRESFVKINIQLELLVNEFI